MSLQHCLDRLSLGDDPPLLARAEAYQEKCSSKVPAKAFDKGPNCKPVICIQLACESLGKLDGWSDKLAAQLAGCRVSAYKNTVSMVKRCLNEKTHVSFESLGVTFGCTQMIARVEQLWEEFSQKYISSLSAVKRKTASEQLQEGAWKPAAFYLCAKALGERIDKSKLQSMCSSSASDFAKCAKAISDTCEQELAALKSKEKRRAQAAASTSQAAKKRKRDTEKLAPAKKNNSAMPVSGVASMISYQPYKETKRYQDYLLWEKHILQRLSA